MEFGIFVNQEDSIIMNKSSVDRGLFCSTMYKTLVTEERKQGSSNVETIEIPSMDIQKRAFNYGLLSKNGVVKRGMPVKCNDVIIGKVFVQNTKNGQEKTDCSVVIKLGEEGYVDKVYDLMTPNGYRLVKVVIRITKIPEIGDKHACLTEDHDVLTTTGWKSIKDITVEDRVACLNRYDNRLVYDNPTHIHQYDYNGDMYHVKNQQLDLFTTPNHRMYIKKRYRQDYELVEARDMKGKRVRFQKNATNMNTPYTFTLPECGIYPSKQIEDMDTWCEFFGWWIAEGWVTKTNRIERGKPTVRYEIQLSQYKDRGVKRITHLISKLGYNYTITKNHKIRIHNKQLAIYLHEYSVGAINKYLPEWVWSLSETQSRFLIEGMMGGDGHKPRNGKSVWTYYTSSSQLADDFQRLLLHAGWSGNKCLRQEAGQVFTIRGKQVKTNATSWKISVVRHKNNPQINHGHIHTQNEQVEEYIPYEGKVYCISVPTEVFYTRRNGKTVWSGNSRSAQKGVVGMLYPQEDMPFTQDGLVPDIIMNTHAFPSRMTTNQIMETVLGKVGCVKGEYGDATPFGDNSINVAEKLCDKLVEAGMTRSGKQVMYSGFTGERLEMDIFIGPTYYQRLKHMVSDKMHARAEGRVTSLMHQPSSGRSNAGGKLMPLCCVIAVQVDITVCDILKFRETLV